MKKSVVKGAIVGGSTALFAWILSLIAMSVSALEFLVVVSAFILLPVEMIFCFPIGLLGELFWRHSSLQIIGPYVAVVFSIACYVAIGVFVGYLIGKTKERKIKQTS